MKPKLLSSGDISGFDLFLARLQSTVTIYTNSAIIANVIALSCMARKFRFGKNIFCSGVIKNWFTTAKMFTLYYSKML